MQAWHMHASDSLSERRLPVQHVGPPPTHPGAPAATLALEGTQGHHADAVSDGGTRPKRSTCSMGQQVASLVP